MAANIEVIVGPPGTGKTTALLERVRAELERGVEPDRIAIVSFSRAACAEFLDRVGKSFGLGADDFPWLCTVHATARRLLDADPGRIVDGKAWREFGEDGGYTFTSTGRASFEHGFQPSPRQTPDDHLRAVLEWGRNRGLDVEKTLSATPCVVPSERFRKFVARYTTFKKDRHLLDFSDLIEQAIASGRVPPVKVAFVDEVQDLSPLQIQAVETWFGGCEKLNVAGDDDQAIYGFQGADPKWLMSLVGKHSTTYLTQSHRIPGAVHALAQRVISRNVNRVPKTYNPRAEPGRVNWMPFMYAMAEVDGRSNTLVVARNRHFLDAVATNLERRAIAYVVDGSRPPNPLAPEVLAAIRAAQNIANGRDADAEDLRAMLEYIPSRGLEFLPHGAKAAFADLKGTVPHAMLRSLLSGGTLLSVAAQHGPLSVLVNLPRTVKDYVSRVQAKHGTFLLPKVQLSTIHGAKGREANLVVVLPDMTKATHAEFVNPRNGGTEAENRVAYVAATRARERLVIAGGRGRHAYPYPVA